MRFTKDKRPLATEGISISINEEGPVDLRKISGPTIVFDNLTEKISYGPINIFVVPEFPSRENPPVLQSVSDYKIAASIAIKSVENRLSSRKVDVQICESRGRTSEICVNLCIEEIFGTIFEFQYPTEYDDDNNGVDRIGISRDETGNIESIFSFDITTSEKRVPHKFLRNKRVVSGLSTNEISFIRNNDGRVFSAKNCPNFLITLDTKISEKILSAVQDSNIDQVRIIIAEQRTNILLSVLSQADLLIAEANKSGNFGIINVLQRIKDKIAPQIVEPELPLFSNESVGLIR